MHSIKVNNLSSLLLALIEDINDVSFMIVNVNKIKIINAETNYCISMNILYNHNNKEVIIKCTLFLLLNTLDI